MVLARRFILVLVTALLFEGVVSYSGGTLHGGLQSASAAATTAKAKKKKKAAIRARVNRPNCNDKRDNDHDGLTDYPNDPGCRSKRDKREKNAGQSPTNPENPNDPSSPPPSGENPAATIPLGVNVSLNGVRPFPANNPWNTDISNEPVDPNSATLIASLGANTPLHPDFGTVWEGNKIGIPYVVVSGTQPKKAVTFQYESDAGPYPIPDNPPIEEGSDRHILMIDRDNWLLYELFYARLSGGKWSAGSGAIFNLNSNALRPDGWTSADAAGLPIFPGLVRYDEVMEQGEIKHALRFTTTNTRRAYVHPATHYASSKTGSNYPPMGMRVRLKANFNISGYPQPVQVILKALKKYGMFLADNGGDWYITGAPDSRWNDDTLATMRGVTGSNFEVVKMGTIITE